MTNLSERILQTWAQHFDLPPDHLRQSGTTLLPDPDRTESSLIILWQAGERIVSRVSSEVHETLSNWLSDRPPDHRLSLDDLESIWHDSSLRRSTDRIYALDEALFHPVVPDDRYTVRLLTQADTDAFDAFQAQCSPEERDEGEIALSDEAICGILDGERIVAGASMYEWRGFADIGVLVDPAYRRQGLGAAVVSYLCQYLMQDERVVVYRHDVRNRGSQGVAESLNLLHFARVDYARRVLIKGKSYLK